MHKFRPSHCCVYIVSEIHGNCISLVQILDRILPLRSHAGQEDQLIFLGDYIDGDENGAEVIDTLLTVKKEFGDRVILLKGNHEDLFDKAIHGASRNYNDWLAIGGQSTINGYLKRAGSTKTYESISSGQLKELVPIEHQNFLTSLETFHIMADEDYFFMHGSFDHNKPISECSLDSLIYDRSASKYVKDCLKKGSVPEFHDSYVFVGAHNHNSKKPYVSQRYIMLGGNGPDKLYVLDLNSMQCCRAMRGKKRLYPHRFAVAE